MNNLGLKNNRGNRTGNSHAMLGSVGTVRQPYASAMLLRNRERLSARALHSYARRSDSVHVTCEWLNSEQASSSAPLAECCDSEICCDTQTMKTSGEEPEMAVL